jgi:hypothetical protein
LIVERTTVLIVFIIMALGASACGSTSSDEPTADDNTSEIDTETDSTEEDVAPSTTQPPQPENTPAPDDAPNVDEWATEVSQVLLDYHEALFLPDSAPPPVSGHEDLPVLGRWVDDATFQVLVTEAALTASPEPLGIASIDEAYAALLAAFDLRIVSATAILNENAENGAALEQEIAATPGAADTPLLIGTSLEPLMTDHLRPTTGRLDDACFELTDALGDLTTVVLVCSGATALLPDGAQAVEQGTIVETPGITIEITSDQERSVVPRINGIEFLGLDGGCVWVGRPAGIADPAGPAGFDPLSELGAMIALPDDLGPWIDDHPALGLVAQGRSDVAGAQDVPYWDIAIPEENIFFVYVNSDPPDGCVTIGFDDRIRLHLIPHQGGPVLAIVGAGLSPDPTEASSILDDLSTVLNTFVITE